MADRYLKVYRVHNGYQADVHTSWYEKQRSYVFLSARELANWFERLDLKIVNKKEFVV